MNDKQNRDGLPDALIEEKRFFRLRGSGKADTPKGWNSPENWQYLDDIPESSYFGFALGNNSNYLLIDGDHVRDPETGKLVPWVKEVLQRIRKAGQTYTEISMSGSGLHMICDLGEYADNFDTESNEDYQKIIQMDPAEYAALPKAERDKVPKIELFYHLTGRYVYLTGNHKRLIQVARDETAAEIFRTLIKIRDEFHEQFAKNTGVKTAKDAAPASRPRFPLSDRDRERLLDALFSIPAGCDRITWVRIGYALFNHGFPFDAFDEWSKHPDPDSEGEICSKYNADEVKKVWKSYRIDGSNWSAGTIFRAAKAAGWTGSELQTTGGQGSSNPPGQFEAVQMSRDGMKNMYLALTEKGRIASQFNNYTEIMQNDAYFRGKLSFNTLSGRHTVSRVWWELDEHAIRDNDISHIREHVAEVYGIQNREDIRQAVEMTAEKQPFNPVERELNSLSWDGVSRIGELFPRYLGAERSYYTEAVTLTLLHGAIQRALNPGIKYDYCIILSDSKQGTGKSTLCRFLALKDEWFCDSLGDLAETDKAFETVRGHWICELGELLATRRTKDIEATKAYLTRQSDLYREKYHLYAESHPRRCVFIGTTNSIAFLPADMSGNRRFIPLRCDGDRQEVHPLEDEAATREYIRQCYAEAMERGRKDGWQLVLPKECAEELAAQQEEATPEDPRIGMIQQWLDTAECCGLDGTVTYKPLQYVCTKMICDFVFYGSVKPHEQREIANILSLKIKGWKRYQGKDGKSKTGRVRFRGTLKTMDDTGIASINTLDKYGLQKAWIREGESCIPHCIPHTDFVSLARDTGGGNAAEDVPFDDDEIDFG